MKCVEITSLQTCFELRVQFHGNPEDQVKSNHARILAMLNLLKIAYEKHSDTFVFSVQDIGTKKPRVVCELGFLALHGLLSTKNEKLTMWKKMKAALRQGFIDPDELKLRKEAIGLKSDDARAFINSYAERAVDTIPTAHTVSGLIFSVFEIFDFRIAFLVVLI
jgi:hypothetical protein